LRFLTNECEESAAPERPARSCLVHSGESVFNAESLPEEER
jgi:hypothetical protein